MSAQSTSLNAQDMVPNVIKYACVRFDDDARHVYIKDIKCVVEKISSPNPPQSKPLYKKIAPKHDEDFDKRKCYHVMWECRKPCTIKSSHRCDPFLKANILYLGGKCTFKYTHLLLSNIILLYLFCARIFLKLNTYAHFMHTEFELRCLHTLT